MKGSTAAAILLGVAGAAAITIYAVKAQGGSGNISFEVWVQEREAGENFNASGVQVAWGTYKEATDSNGLASFKGVQAGKAALTISPPGFVPLVVKDFTPVDGTRYGPYVFQVS